MARYRKMPVEVEAFRYTGEDCEPPEWFREALRNGVTEFKTDQEWGQLYIKTLEGDHHASVDDYIIKGIQGELYPCKPDIFEQTYELVEGVEPNEPSKPRYN